MVATEKAILWHTSRSDYSRYVGGVVDFHMTAVYEDLWRQLAVENVASRDDRVT